MLRRVLVQVQAEEVRALSVEGASRGLRQASTRPAVGGFSLTESFLLGGVCPV